MMIAPERHAVSKMGSSRDSINSGPSCSMPRSNASSGSKSIGTSTTYFDDPDVPRIGVPLLPTQLVVTRNSALFHHDGIETSADSAYWAGIWTYAWRKPSRLVRRGEMTQ